MKYKNILITFLGACTILASVFFGTIFYYDPLKILHKPWNNETYLQTSMREQALGILKYWEYDSVVLGTSIFENTSSKEASEKLGGSFVNISIAGSDYFERSFILEYALKHKNIKTILYSLDDLGSTRKGDPIYSYKKWNYLYDNNPMNDIKIYLNNKYLKCFFSFTDMDSCRGVERDFDRPKAWYTDKTTIATFGGFDEWIKHKDNVNMKHAFHLISTSFKKIQEKRTIDQHRITLGIERTKKYINRYILPHVQAYPNTEFILVIPPYSRLVYALIAKKDIDSFIVYKASIKYLVNLAKEEKNIKIFAWEDEDFLDDISNYRDLTHFSANINSWMITAIRDKKGLLTIQNINKYLDSVTQKTLDYNLSLIEHKMKKEKLY